MSSSRVYAAVRADDLESVDQVTKAVRAGGGCGTCHPEIEEVLAEVRGEPVEPGVILENRLVCRQETELRIEGSLESLIRPKLATLGATLEGCEIDGLRVRVRLGGDASGEAARLVDEKLRKYVCADLEVEVDR